MAKLATQKNSRATSSTLPCGRPKPSLNVEDSKPVSIDDTLSLLNRFCSERKLNRSEAREKIVETIVRQARHFTALDLLARLEKTYPEIGKATLYRNLPVLVESGILIEGPHDSNGQVMYELASEDHHDHIICADCGQIFEFHDETIESRQDQITKKAGFSTKSHRHVILAACDLLKKTKARKK